MEPNAIPELIIAALEWLRARIDALLREKTNG